MTRSGPSGGVKRPEKDTKFDRSDIPQMTKANMIRTAIFTALLFLLASFSFAQTTATYIEKMPGWESCSICAGAGGNGPTIKHTMTQNVSSPTMGKKSAQFTITPGVRYGDALWWKQLGSQPNAHNFVYDTYFYLKNPTVSQALEFDINQSVNGKKYIFGTQCAVQSHAYEVWSSTLHWVKTGIPCGVPSAYKWHHLTIEAQRTSGGKVMFVSVTIDGKKSYINRTYSPQNSGAHELNVAFQMDGNRYKQAYDSWVEQLSLKYW